MTVLSLNRRQALAGLAASAATLAACAPARVASLPALSPATLLDDMAERLLAVFPESATSLGLDTGARSALRGRLGGRGPADMAALASLLREDLARTQGVDMAGLDASTRTSFEVVKSAYGVALDGLVLPYGDVAVGGWRNAPYVVIQNVGAWLDIPRFLDSEHPVRDAADAEAWLERLARFPALLDGERERMRSAAGMGVIPPGFLIDKATAAMRLAVADAAQGGELVASLTRRTANIPGRWEDRARRIARDEVAPALARQLAEFEAQRPRASDKAGLWAQPRGEEFYAWALRASTTTRRSAAEIHRQGLEELASLHTRMEPILQRLGYSKGTVGERMAALGHDPRFRFSPDDTGRAEILALMQSSIDFIRTRLPLAFRELVPGRLEIRRLPLAEEPGAPNAYGGPGSIDGTIPGKIFVNLGDTARHSRFSVPDLAFHEGIPGHVWQGEYAIRLPLIRALLSFNAYSEGWALYAEQLADELGAYDDNEVGRLGYLQSLAFRACRMVVDTGIHAMQWTREQGVAFFVENNGSNPKEVASEVDRYCSWPGQACGYKMGHTEIVRLREKAQAALGDRYDLRDFNQTVVGGGNVPLDVLSGTVDRYIAGA